MVSPTATIQSAPPELVSTIFTYACTDGGPTGCALSLVCRAFRDVCLDTGVDIQSALVGGKPKIQAFIEVLHKRAPHKRRVEALFLSYRSGDRSEEGSGWRRLRQGPKDVLQDTVDLMLEVLRAISASHLRILRADFPRGWISPIPLFPVYFPSLAELSITGMLQSSSWTYSHHAPALERLCIGPHLWAQEGFGLALKTTCPRITHLRITASQERPLDDNVLRFVHAFCGLTKSLSLVLQEHHSVAPSQPRRKNGTAIIDRSSIPADLHRVIVEFSPMFRRSRGCGNGIRDHRGHVDAYHTVASEATRSGKIEEREDREGLRRSLLVFPCPPDLHEADAKQHDREEYVRAKREWLERYAGTGPGCWE